VVEANVPDTLAVNDVQLVDDEMVLQWSLRFSNAGLILVGAGPPCQGVSGLNADRKGAFKDSRSNFFSHVPRIAKLCKQKFPWTQVRTLAENVASMDAVDCEVMPLKP
jgi:site-specific DNA-cytosine methylase